jgi:hypothetical protein
LTDQRTADRAEGVGVDTPRGALSPSLGFVIQSDLLAVCPALLPK